MTPGSGPASAGSGAAGSATDPDGSAREGPAAGAASAPAARSALSVRSAQAGAQAEFARTASAYLRGRAVTAGAVAVDAGSGVTVSSNAHLSSYTASIVKLDILAALLLQRQDGHRMPTAPERALARRMITASDNDAASSLWRVIGGACGLAAANRRLGLHETTPGAGTLWGLTRTTPADQLRLLEVVTGTAPVLGASARAYAAELLADVAADQTWGVSAAAAAGTGSVTRLKNGWLPYSGDGYRWIVNSVGRVRGSGGSTLLLAVLTRRSASLAAGIDTVEQLSRLAARAVAHHPAG